MSVNINPQENTVPTWLLPYTCEQQICHCHVRFKPEMLHVKGLPYLSTPPLNPSDNLTIQIIKFTYTNNKFSRETINNIITKHQVSINNLSHHGWKIGLLVAITAGARGTTHAPSMKHMEIKFQLFEAINTNNYLLCTFIGY